MQGGNDGFSLIWEYWFKKYMTGKKGRKKDAAQLSDLKRQYHIEAIESSTTSSIHQKLNAIAGNQGNASTPTALGIYTIDPAAEAHNIQQLLHADKDLINELHSYYLNSNSVYIIYRQEKEDLILEPLAKIINEDESLGQRNDSLIDSLDKLEDKIEHLELLDQLAEFDGVEIWDAKYMDIPHSFVKTKKMSWARALNRPLNHPSQPRTISELPLIPRITAYHPSPDKLMPFISFMKMLEDITPDTSPLPMPTIESIFQYNHLPYIFVQDYKEQSIAILCYYVVFGENEGPITENLVERWMKQHPVAPLTKAILDMKESLTSRSRYSKDGVSRGLGLLTGQDSDGNQIW